MTEPWHPELEQVLVTDTIRLLGPSPPLEHPIAVTIDDRSLIIKYLPTQMMK